jgi:hypothetical protein
MVHTHDRAGGDRREGRGAVLGNLHDDLHSDTGQFCLLATPRGGLEVGHFNSPEPRPGRPGKAHLWERHPFWQKFRKRYSRGRE